jgi:hypothetical protein
MWKYSNAVGLVILLTSLPTSGFAVDKSIKGQLLKLDPQTRLEQACDAEAMVRIRADEHEFRPDKVIAYTFRDPTYGPNMIKAPGAVFRSKGEWYHLSYTCSTGPEHVHVRTLDFAIGGRVAKANWDKYFLYE